MCLLVVAWRVHPEFPLILIGNRDEFHDRPTQPAHWWAEPEGILAGRDLQAGGSWLGVSRDGRIAVVTNFREPGSVISGQRSRGELVVEFLASSVSARHWMDGLADRRVDYGGFNLVLGDGDQMHYLSNRGEDHRGLEPGVYGLSNQHLDTPWPKVVAVRNGLRQLIDDASVDSDALFDLLADRRPAPDGELPDTGVPLEWERALSPVFIAGPEYGTRASTVVRVGAATGVEFEERRFGPCGDPAGVSRFSF